MCVRARSCMHVCVDEWVVDGNAIPEGVSVCASAFVHACLHACVHEWVVDGGVNRGPRWGECMCACAWVPYDDADDDSVVVFCGCGWDRVEAAKNGLGFPGVPVRGLEPACARVFRRNVEC